jgi:DNA-binding YbaB/EbfC family protein
VAQQPNLNKMMKQLQQAQEAMAVEQEKLRGEIVEASAGGGMVNVKVTGDLQVTEITIDPQAVDPEDVEMLQDMLLAAVNDALRSSQQLAEQRLGGIAGGLGLPGM